MTTETPNKTAASPTESNFSELLISFTKFFIREMIRFDHEFRLLSSTLAISVAEHTHTDPISNAPVELISFVDMDTNASFSLDSCFVEQGNDLKIIGPYTATPTFLVCSSTKLPALNMDLLAEDNFSGDVMNLAALCAIHIAKNRIAKALVDAYSSDPIYDIRLTNVIKEKALSLLDLDMDSEPWTDTYGGATSLERSALLLDQIMEFIKPVLAKDNSLYAVIPECLYLYEWVQSASEENLDSALLAGNIWTANVMDEDHGWSANEVEAISELEVHDALWGYGDFCHHIIRIK